MYQEVYGWGLLAIVIITVGVLFSLSIRKYGFRKSVKPWIIMILVMVTIGIVVAWIYKNI